MIVDNIVIKERKNSELMHAILLLGIEVSSSQFVVFFLLFLESPLRVSSLKYLNLPTRHALE